ncbi:hypothetical protein HOLleu_44248 [Holothuria leucospilota]|uniref:Uncharacterized protein n=1 Tax=Holothuria leucospilota TaxID=206669 RepID=A0A9Q0YG24_HOLLE|nr:hypothetical protein HOLleu_44248 [Holothuria leucospilota]
MEKVVIPVQFALKLRSHRQNLTFETAFNHKFSDIYMRKPSAIPPFVIRVGGALSQINDGSTNSHVTESRLLSMDPVLCGSANFILHAAVGISILKCGDQDFYSHFKEKQSKRKKKLCACQNLQLEQTVV